MNLILKILSRVFHLLAGVGACCRFEPTCSQYFSEAIHQHGLARGSFFGVRRLLRCRPFGGTGFDPVPIRNGRSAPRSA